MITPIGNESGDLTCGNSHAAREARIFRHGPWSNTPCLSTGHAQVYTSSTRSYVYVCFRGMSEREVSGWVGEG